jgi:hypothetical protein
MIKFLVLFSSLVVSFVPAYSQTFIQGKVAENGSGTGIPYASIGVSSSSGTATDESGKFTFKVEEEHKGKRLHVSCVGYAAKSFSLDSLLLGNTGEIILSLTPMAIVLDEVQISSKKLDAEDIASGAMESISKNYTSNPFNMEFYSTIRVVSENETHYLVENIVETYRNGYVEGVENRSKILHKRISGTSPLADSYDKKTKTYYFPYEKISVFDIFIADMVGVGKKYDYTVFNPEFFKKLNFTPGGITYFENDTVNVVNYSPKNSKGVNSKNGTLLISATDQAILKHTRTIGEIELEVIYRKWNDKYFPYFIKAVYPVKQKGKQYSVILEVYIREIRTKNVNTHKDIDQYAGHLSDIPYDEAFWNANYPAKK